MLIVIIVYAGFTDHDDGTVFHGSKLIHGRGAVFDNSLQGFLSV